MTDIAGLTNALTDIMVNVRDCELEYLGLEKARYKRMKNIDESRFFELMSKKKKTYYQAGSPANLIFNTSLLGLKTALLGTVGKDEIGKKYIEKIKNSGIKSIISECSGNSGICYVLISPDGERTILTDTGVAKEFSFDMNELKKARILHTSGYELVTNPDRTLEVVDYAKKINSKISFDLADPEMIKRQRGSVEQIISKTDVLFMTEEEAEELTGLEPEKALKEMSKICPVVALKKGARGSVVRKDNRQYSIQTYPSKIISTCGAGDAYASGFLFAYLSGLSTKECGNMGSYIASRVCNSKKSHL
ncbi:MAG: adenosine kinase [Candidatus Paceibacterota bacterium]